MPLCSRGARDSDTDRCWRTSTSSLSQTVVPSSTRPARAIVPVLARSDSTSVVLPAPACPTRTTLRTLSAVRGSGALPASRCASFFMATSRVRQAARPVCPCTLPRQRSRDKGRTPIGPLSFGPSSPPTGRTSMLNLRPAVGRVVGPLAARLLRLGVTPDMVTIAGVVGSVAASFALVARGHFLVGGIVVTLCVLTDALDGTMARLRGPAGPWGAFLDSTLDRIADASLFAALVIWYAGRGDDDVLLAVSLFCLVAGVITSYAKARAEGLGMTANVGIAERAERLILVLAGVILAGMGLDIALPVLLWVLAVVSAVTVVQRLVEVHRQAHSTAS